jgi:hypothetical protein
MNWKRASWLLLTVAGCGGALATSYDVSSAAPTPDVFGCLRDSLRTVGFTQSSYDLNDYRLTAVRYDNEATRPDVQFHRLVERLEFEVGPGADGSLTRVTGTASTFAELATQRGPTEQQEKTSERTREAGQALLDKCTSPVDSTKVPG